MRIISARHAAALVLLGWYLMVPPSTDGGKSFDVRAPLSRWSDMDSFDTARECKNALGREASQTAKRFGLLSVEALREGGSRCIASDDPRLAK